MPGEPVSRAWQVKNLLLISPLIIEYYQSELYPRVNKLPYEWSKRAIKKKIENIFPAPGQSEIRY